MLTVDPKPTFDLSPYLYMQFMEPLGTTDGSVAAAWDSLHDRWRPDLIDATRELAPTMVRWGGCLSSYYRWKEGVGPRDQRKPMVNLLWGGVETNQVGTGEFVDFCGQVGAEPLMTVNFESDGRKNWAHPAQGGERSAGPEEAAEWVAYCKSKGLKIRFWQIGNETSYDKNGFDRDTAAARTLAFAKAMRKADSSIQLIGWGDSGWARRMIETTGDQLQYIAVHHHFDSGLPDSPLKGTDYRKDPELTWRHLMHACKSTEDKIRGIRAEIEGTSLKLALTESHFALPGRNRCDVLSTWAAGVSNARILNVHERNGDILKIATLADFCGTRWMNNAIMIPTPGGHSYLMPVARVMSLYRKHGGDHACGVTSVPDELDVTASRTGNRIFLHVVNTNRTKPIAAQLAVDGMRIVSARAFEIAAPPEEEIEGSNAGALSPKERAMPIDGTWEFPAASVTAVELTVE